MSWLQTHVLAIAEWFKIVHRVPRKFFEPAGA